MTNEQKFFLENVEIIMSPQEKDYYVVHITDYLDQIGVKWKKMYKPNHLTVGDYSFVILGKDYRNDWLCERKFALCEVDKCLTDKNKETKRKIENQDFFDNLGADAIRDNLEYELGIMCKLGVKEKWLFIEQCNDFESIKEYSSGYELKEQTAGQRIYSTLSSWSCANRYDFRIQCLPNKKQFAKILLIKMFYYWRNEMKQKYGKNFLIKIKKIKEETGNEL